jgi:XTP/dITP diphosphohydrolase
MLNELLIATGNKHKFREIVEFLADVPWKLRGVTEFPGVPPAAEDGDTFESNAMAKARHYCDRLGLACVADDSGLVVDALNGAPGVISARYAGVGATDDQNNARLLRELQDVRERARSARFVCCSAFVAPGGDCHVECGEVEGRIAFAPRGPFGFGYDPLFIPNGHRMTFGELSPSVKAQISHRSRAFAKMRSYLLART